MKRAEIDRLRADLQKSEDNLHASEQEVEKQSTMVAELNKYDLLQPVKLIADLLLIMILQLIERSRNSNFKQMRPSG
jgi:hypothetical protein